VNIWIVREIDDTDDKTTWEDYYQTLEAARQGVNNRFHEVEPKATEELEWEDITEVADFTECWYASSDYDKVYYVSAVEVKP
jgi:hypothetical protein